MYPTISSPQKTDIIKNSTLLLLLGAGAVGYFLYTKSSAAKSLVFSFGGLGSPQLNGGNPSVTVNLVAQNTSSTSLLLNSFAGNLFSNNTLIGNVSNFSGVTIPGNSSTTVPLTVQLLTLGLVSDLFTAISNGNVQQNLELSGQANINGIQAPVDLKFSTP